MRISESTFQLICQKSSTRGFGRSIDLSKWKRKKRYKARLLSWNRIFTRRGEVNRCLVEYSVADGECIELIDIDDSDLKDIQNGQDAVR